MEDVVPFVNVDLVEFHSPRHRHEPQAHGVHGFERGVVGEKQGVLRPPWDQGHGGGGVLENRISCLKNPPEPNLKGGGAFKEVFRYAGVLSTGRAPRPPNPPPPPHNPTPNEIHSVGHLQTVGYAA